MPDTKGQMSHTSTHVVPREVLIETVVVGISRTDWNWELYG